MEKQVRGYRNIPHDSSIMHARGESVFIDDRSVSSNEVYVGLITSPLSRGKLRHINISLAQKHPHWLGLWSAADLKVNRWGAIISDQPLLVDTQISYHYEVIAVFASQDRESVEDIKKLVSLEIDEEEGIFTLDRSREKAIDDKSFIVYQPPAPFVRGDIKKAFKAAPHILKGVVKSFGQEHFYLESQACIAYPLEQGQLELHCSTQHPSEVQRLVGEALGVSFHHVVCNVKRMGGAFGGKESQAGPIAVYAALVAKKLNRPARLVLSKDEDMKITGKRHPFETSFEVAFDEKGRVLALKALLESDAGAYLDLSSAVLERAMLHVDGAYYLENCLIDGACYKTNNTPHTAFRGFGAPQAHLVIESIMEDIAFFLNKDSYQVRRLNLYENKKNETPYGQIIENNNLPHLFDTLYLKSNYEQRVLSIKEFNKKNTGKLKGISMTGAKFGIAFTARFLNQANAIVNIYLDGSAQLSTGATEMGQGVNTKMGQIVSETFGIDCNRVQVMSTSTEKNNNTSPTAASSGFDINGAATLKACLEIKKRLSFLALKVFSKESIDENEELDIDKNIKEEDLVDIIFCDSFIFKKNTNKKISFKDLINIAYLNRISLGERSFYKSPDLGFSKEKGEGNAFRYYTQGCAVSEVLLCEYTGELKVVRSDIYMDIGESLNPGIDRGQVLGAFIQGMGMLTTEQLVYSDKGELLTHSPTTYKIPSIQDIPREFFIDFMENEGAKSLKSSKAVGEPPFVLGISVWTAIKNALSYRSSGELVELSSAATNEVILNELYRIQGEAL